MALTRERGGVRTVKLASSDRRRFEGYASDSFDGASIRGIGSCPRRPGASAVTFLLRKGLHGGDRVEARWAKCVDDGTPEPCGMDPLGQPSLRDQFAVQHLVYGVDMAADHGGKPLMGCERFVGVGPEAGTKVPKDRASHGREFPKLGSNVDQMNEL